MAYVKFTPALQRHVACEPGEAAGQTVRQVLEAMFERNPVTRAYVLDDQAALRKHMVIFVKGRRIKDRVHLSDAVGEQDEVLVLQSLSGG